MKIHPTKHIQFNIKLFWSFRCITFQNPHKYLTQNTSLCTFIKEHRNIRWTSPDDKRTDRTEKVRVECAVYEWLPDCGSSILNFEHLNRMQFSQMRAPRRGCPAANNTHSHTHGRISHNYPHTHPQLGQTHTHSHTHGHNIRIVPIVYYVST